MTAPDVHVDDLPVRLGDAARSELRSELLNLAGFEHEVKTAATIIGGWAETLESNWRSLADDHRLHAVAIMGARARSLGADCERLLGDTRERMADLARAPERVDWADSIAPVIQALDGMSPDHSVTLHATGPRDVWVSPPILEQVVSHLVENAIKYSPEGGTVSVRLKGGPDTMALEVLDGGVGIPDDIEVLVPFARGRDAESFGAGTGLGLYLVNQLVQSMGGELTASRRAGGGSTFRVELPGGRCLKGATAPPAEAGPVPERRDRIATERDVAARRRDGEATARDKDAAGRDAEGAARERAASAAVASANGNTTAELRARLAVVRDGAVADRSAASNDRHAAARDRASAAADRQSALADRDAAVAERTASLVDELTGVHRRGAGLMELKRDIARVRRSRQRLVVAFVDVDGLKLINDSRGHAAGDQTLLDVATALRAKLRPYDLVLRYGGDEFVCALSGLSLKDAEKRLALVNTALLKSPRRPSVTVGLAALWKNEPIESVLARADAALYRARHLHRPKP